MNLKSLKFNIRIPDLHRNNPINRKTRSRNDPSAHHINPRFRAYGRARLDIANRVKSQEDWDELWKSPTNPFALRFPWGVSWKQCIEYYVVDFAAEIGFWIDIFGLSVTALGPDYAQFTSPGGEISFAVASTEPDEQGTPITALRLQFFIEDLIGTYDELCRRSIQFDQPPLQVSTETSLSIATFHTPHGIAVDLWSESPAARAEFELQQPTEPTEMRSMGGAAGFNDDYTQIIQEEVDALQMVSSSGIENHTSIKETSWQEFLTIPVEYRAPEQNPSKQAAPEVMNPRQISTEIEFSRQNWSDNLPSFEEKTTRMQESRLTYHEAPADLLNEDNAVEGEEEADWEEDEEDEDEVSDEIVYEALVDEEESNDVEDTDTEF
jgi:hypothetical protein